MFDESSQLVKTWVFLVKQGTYTRDQVPKLSNLQEMVYTVLDKENEETEE